MSDINELLAALKSNLGSAEEIIETQSLLEKRKDLQEQFKQSPIDATIEQLVKNIDANEKILQATKNLVEQTDQPEYIESFSNVSKANSENLKILSLLITEREKIRSQEELKKKEMEEKEKLARLQIESKEKIAKMNIESKEKIAEGKKVEQPKLQQNNMMVLTATRDQLFDALFSDKKEEKMKELLKDNGLIQDAEVVESV
jgi:hypothetical protein